MNRETIEAIVLSLIVGLFALAFGAAQCLTWGPYPSAAGLAAVHRGAP